MSPLQQQLLHRARSHPGQLYLSQPLDRVWRDWTWSQAFDEASRMATVLQQLGLEPGDRVGIVSRNCAHWVLADMAIILAGLVSVPIYPTANAATIRSILTHSETRLCFVGKLESPDQQYAGIPSDILSIAFPYPDARGQRHWDQLLADAAPLSEPVARLPEDLATLLYTSGSTGEPKGAMHSHASFAWVGENLPKGLGAQAGDRVLSYLPLSHCTERAYVEASSFYVGLTLYFVESLETFAEDLAHVRPTLFGSVPRLWKKFQLGILAKLPQHKLDLLLRIPLVSSLIRRRIKRGLGLDQAQWFASGSAPIAVSLLQWWERIGITICEGWGMTETFAYGTQTGRNQAPRLGSIGKALPGVDLKVSEQQELLIRCPCLTDGYYKAPELNDSLFVDGFLRTGDRAFIDAEGWVSITGRVKELFKTEKGKYIAPVPLESLLARNAHIEMACVLGSGLPQPVALLQLAETAPADRAELVRELEQTLTALNQELESHQRLSRLFVIKGSWETANGMLTPTLKLKRDVIEQHYAGLIAAKHEQKVVFEGEAPG